MKNNSLTNHETIDFVRKAIKDDLSNKRFDYVQTRWPPEPNGFIGIGHAKAITLNFDIAKEFGGKCSLRFDDTNPEKESIEYVNAIKEDIKWLGFDWGKNEFYASDYFERLYEFAEELIKTENAYVDDLSIEQIREYRGAPSRPGKESPNRRRSAAENLDLFRRMRAGDFTDGQYVLRAKIDMSSPNLNLRDPIMYRIRHITHHRSGDKWCIYPLYDWAHGQSDSIEGVTHSLCSLEFENNRPLYKWFLEHLNCSQPRQIEFNHLNVTYSILHKRILRKLVSERLVQGWDDPRLLTLRGLRRRGFTPKSIKDFVRSVGLSKTRVLVEYAQLEYFLRQELNKSAQRVMAVLNPLRVVITNFPSGKTEYIEAENNPEDSSAGIRKIPFTREIYIERDDFMENPPKKFFRLGIGREIRLKHAYYITCNDVLKDKDGEIIELHCTLDPDSKGGGTADGRKVKGTLPWVSGPDSVSAEVRLFDHLFTKKDMNDVAVEELQQHINSNSQITLNSCKIEPSMANVKPGQIFQFMRQGYFVVDNVDSKKDRLVFNRAVGLRDSWSKINKS